MPWRFPSFSPQTMRWLVLVWVLALSTACSAPPRQAAASRLALASAYYQNGQYRVALEESRKALDAQPDEAQAYGLQGLIYMRLREPVLAEQHFLRAEALAPSNADIAHNHGLFLCEQNQFLAAFERFGSATAQALYMDKAKTFWLWGVCAEKSGDLISAQDRWQQSLASQLNSDAAVALANSYQIRNQNEQALGVLRDLNRSELMTAESLWLGVQVARKAGDQTTFKQYATLLQTRFPASSQWGSFQREAFNE